MPRAQAAMQTNVYNAPTVYELVNNPIHSFYIHQALAGQQSQKAKRHRPARRLADTYVHAQAPVLAHLALAPCC